MPIFIKNIISGAQIGKPQIGKEPKNFWAYYSPSAIRRESIPAAKIERSNSNAIYKKNKHGNPALSELEVGISAVWESCVPESTSPYELVIDEDNKTTGVLSKKINNFIPLSTINNSNPIAQLTRNVGEQKRLKRELARILVMCYCLEEDDLHRDNIGAYKDTHGKFHIVKIDHDLSFYQSIMSVSGNRRIYRVNDEHRFIASPKDITEFPLLTSSDIHYWPTTSHLLEGSPGYDRNLRDWFESLNKDKDFRDAAYQAFFEFVNVNPLSVRSKIQQRLGEDKPEITSMVVDSLIARQAEIRSCLYVTPEIKRWLNKEKEEKYDPSRHKNKMIRGDTILHAAIRTNDFKFLNLDHYKNEIKENIRNSKGETPLLLALKANNINAMEGLLIRGAKVNITEMRDYLRKTKRPENEVGKKIWQLLLRATPNTNIEEKILHAIKEHKEKQHIDKVKVISTDYDGSRLSVDRFLHTKLAAIRDNFQLSLSEKKLAAVQCIQGIIRSITTAEDLENIFKLIDSSEFNFIRQLNSDFWLIRQLRGSHGVTSTYKTIYAELNTAANNMLASKKDEDRNKLIALANKDIMTKSKIDAIAGFFTNISETKKINEEVQKNTLRSSRLNR